MRALLLIALAVLSGGCPQTQEMPPFPAADARRIDAPAAASDAAGNAPDAMLDASELDGGALDAGLDGPLDATGDGAPDAP